MPKNTRCEEVIVQLVVRTYDDQNRPVQEHVSQPVKVLRNASTLNFWAAIDEHVKAMTAQATAADAINDKAKKGKRK